MSDIPHADDTSPTSAETAGLPSVGQAAAGVDEPLAEDASPGEPLPLAPLYQPGDIIAQKYQLAKPLGAGGMGAVWLARNLKLDVDVAIKLIRHELGTVEASHRLLQEARAAARIGHRSIVRIFDFGETELDDPFIVMEVLTGESLRELLKRKGRLPAAHAVRALLPIASALAEAHASGIVHRDLKPENIMLVPDKSGGALPKLLDFGIAKFASGEDPGEEPRRRLRMAVGTPDYMAPEQAGGHDDVHAAADVWALAVILYEAITGRVPFAGPNYAALIFAIMTAEPTATHEQAAGDAELWSIIVHALAKRDEDRPSMRAFGVSLAEWALARGIDSDIAGTSLAAHWQGDSSASPFSEAPPPVSEDAIAHYDVTIPRPAGVPKRWRAAEHLAPTDAPPAGEEAGSEPELQADPRPPPRRVAGALWPIGAVAVAAALGFGVLRGGAAPAPVTIPKVPEAPSAPAPLPAASSEPAAPASAASPVVADTPASSAVPAVTTAKVRGAAGSAQRPGKPPPRKGGLPIAKQPNF